MSKLSGVKKFIQTTLEIPQRRTDGDLVKGTHPYRKLMPYIMPGRNESVCYYDDYIRSDKMLDYIERARAAFGTDVNITHLLVAAASNTLHQNPTMNQFISGSRLYRRKNVDVTFSMKRKKLNKKAKLSAVKMRMDEPEESFQDLVERINSHIHIERSGRKTSVDQELDILSLLPRRLMTGVVSTVNWLDYNNILPKLFMEQDGFYTSMFIANLGSLGMRPAFHHLYEYGNCPLFLMVGRIEERPMVRDGVVVAENIMHIRWSYDERIDDGLSSNYGMTTFREALEDPDQFFGELPEVPAKLKTAVA